MAHRHIRDVLVQFQPDITRQSFNKHCRQKQIGWILRQRTGLHPRRNVQGNATKKAQVWPRLFRSAEENPAWSQLGQR